ncbi:rhodanese-like domain-containing protein [Patescibacteria group bacterium]
MKRLFPILFLISAILIFNSCSDQSAPNTDDLQASVLQIQNYEIAAKTVGEKMKNGDDFHLIDVRTVEENDESQIIGSKLMTLDQLNFYIVLDADISFDDEIVVYCRSGNRSKTAYDILTQMGYKNVKSMAGGIKEWKSLGYNTCSKLDNTC